MQADAFGFVVAWAPGAVVVVEAAPALGEPGWSPVSTHVLSGGLLQFSDAGWATDPSRFYRVRTELMPGEEPGLE